MTTISTLKLGDFEVAEEFSKVIAISRVLNPIFLTAVDMSEVFAIPLRKVVNFSLKGKLLKIKSEGVQKFGPIAFPSLFVLLLAVGTHSFAQVETPIKGVPGRLPSKRDTPNPATGNLLKKDTSLIKS